MTLRRQAAAGERKTRTQGALVAALRARPRTSYRAVRRVLVAKASIFNSLLEDQHGADDDKEAHEHDRRVVLHAPGLSRPDDPAPEVPKPRHTVDGPVDDSRVEPPPQDPR